MSKIGHMIIWTFLSQKPRKQSAAVTSMNHESSCISSLGKAASAYAQRSGKLK
jgi:hypothetical protein